VRHHISHGGKTELFLGISNVGRTMVGMVQPIVESVPLCGEDDDQVLLAVVSEHQHSPFILCAKQTLGRFQAA
jgi:hypothetical protein